MDLMQSVLETLAKDGVKAVDQYVEDVPRIPVSLGIDYMTNGGIPRGRVTTVTSEDTYAGKTTFCSLIIKAVTNNPDKMLNGGNAALFDMEGTYRMDWADSIGIDRDHFVLLRYVDVVEDKKRATRKMTGEEMMQSVVSLIKSNAVDVIVVDSVKFTRFASQMAVKPGESVWGIAARHWADFCGQMEGLLARSNVALILVNHMGTKMNEFKPTPEYGGKTIPQMATLRIQMLAPEKPKNDKDRRVILHPKVYKDKLSPQRKECFLNLYDGVLSEIKEVVEYGKTLCVFTKEDGSKLVTGKWYYKTVYLGKSAAEVQQYLIDNPPLYFEIYEIVHGLICNAVPGTLVETQEYDE